MCFRTVSIKTMLKSEIDLFRIILICTIIPSVSDLMHWTIYLLFKHELHYFPSFSVILRLYGLRQILFNLSELWFNKIKFILLYPYFLIQIIFYGLSVIYLYLTLRVRQCTHMKIINHQI